MERHYLIAYDLALPRTRRRVLKMLDDYAYRLQYSVYEMCVDEQTLSRIEKWIESVIDKETDSVLIYEMNAASIRSRKKYGKPIPAEEQYNSTYQIVS